MATRLEEDEEFPPRAEDFAEDASEALDAGEAERLFESVEAGEGDRTFGDAREDDAEEDWEDVDSLESDSDSEISESESDASSSSDADSESDADDSESEDEESEELLEELAVGDADLETSLSSDCGRVGTVCNNFEVDCFFFRRIDSLSDTFGLF